MEKKIVRGFQENIDAWNEVLKGDKEDERSSKIIADLRDKLGDRVITLLKNVRAYNHDEEDLVECCVVILEEYIALVRVDQTPALFNVIEKIGGSSTIIIDCENRAAIPSIVDMHVHLRDLGQGHKETFVTGTKAASLSGISTVLDMPNTSPPATSAFKVKKWMETAEGSVYCDVGFIAGVPENIDEEEIKNILKLGVFGFKIYPSKSLQGVDWLVSENLEKLFTLSMKHKFIVFIHPDQPLEKKEFDWIVDNYEHEVGNMLGLHDSLYPIEMEVEFIKKALKAFVKVSDKKKLAYPRLHFCHVSSERSFNLLEKAKGDKIYISFEVTPHHMLLSDEIKLKNENHGKVLPPLRYPRDRDFLLKKMIKGKVRIIGTDHAPHTLEEKAMEYSKAPSGFPSFDTYPRLLLDKVLKGEIPMKHFVHASSENPLIRSRIGDGGYIHQNCLANILILDEVPEYEIDTKTFNSKAKYSPYVGMKTTVKPWKVFFRGKEITDDSGPTGRVLHPDTGTYL